MSIMTPADIMAHVGLTGDAPAGEAEGLMRKAEAAQNHIERLLGFRIEERFGGEDQEPIPPALVEAVMQLAAWWFENRETVSDRGEMLPFGVEEIVNEYREWSF